MATPKKTKAVKKAKKPAKTTKTTAKKTIDAPDKSKKIVERPTVAATADTGADVTEVPAATVQQPETPSRLKRYLKATGRFVLRSSAPEILLLASLVIARYLPNSDFSYPNEIIVPTLLLGALASIFYYLFKLILKRPLAAHAAALPLAYGFYAYSYAFAGLRHVADTLTPDSLATPFMSAAVTLLVWAVVFGLIGFILDLIIRRFKQLRELPLLKIAVFAICVIFVMQLGKLGQRLWVIRDQLGYSHGAQQLPQDKAAIKSKPNVYYLVFDRYASNETLKNIYNYDNSAMTNFLAGQGFVTRPNAYSNYPFTPQSVSSTLSMQYHAQLGKQFKQDAAGFQTAFPYRDILDKSPVSEIFKQNGYAYIQVSSWWDFTRNNPTANSEPSRSFRLRVFGMTFWMRDLQRDIINKSILSPLLLKGATVGKTAIIKYDRDYNPRENFESQMTALTAIAENSKTQTKPQFTFGHILSPHDPYVFTETGESPTYSVDRNDDQMDETQKYTNQLKYVNGRFQDLIRTIRTNDKNAVVIIQADEGPYPKQFRGTLTPTHYYDPVNLPLEQMRQKFGILASYYLPGVDKKTTQQQMTSSVNTFRFVLDQYLGYKLDPLPDCQFTAGNKYYMYTYRLVSGKLRGTPEPDVCRQYQ